MFRLFILLFPLTVFASEDKELPVWDVLVLDAPVKSKTYICEKVIDKETGLKTTKIECKEMEQ